MSLSTTLPKTGNTYDEPIYNTPRKKQLRASSSRKMSTTEQVDQQAIMQQWHEVMQKIQSERQEISDLQKEADEKQAAADKQSLTPELKKLMDQVQDLKDEKADLDFELARIRQKYTPETKLEIDNEVLNLRRDFFIDTEELEQIFDNISKMKNKSKNFLNEEPAKSVLEAEKRVTELTHKLNDLYRESAQIDVDFEETFNPTDNGVKKENRKVTYLKRKLQLAENESEKRMQEIEKMTKEHEKAKELIKTKQEEEERKKKIRAEMNKNRRREMIAQQAKASGYDEDANKEKENKNDDDSDLEKILGLDSDFLNSYPKKKRKRITKKKKTANKTDENGAKTNDNNAGTVSNNNNAKKNVNSPKSKTYNGNYKNQSNEDSIFQDATNKNVAHKKDSVEIDDEKDLVKIGQSGSESDVQLIDGNETGNITDKLINTTSKDKSKKVNEDEIADKDENENIINDEKAGENETKTENGNDNKSDNENLDDEEYDYIECKYNQTTLLDVSPESFSKSPTGNFSSMLASGLGLLNKEKDQQFQIGKIKIKKNSNKQNNLSLWSSQESDQQDDQSSINIEPLYDFEYNQDWKIVSKTLKNNTSALDVLLSSNAQTDNSQNDEATNGTERKVNEVNKEQADNKTENKNEENKENTKNEEENNEDGKNLSSVLDGANSLFDKEGQSKTEEENNESTEKNIENKEENKNENKEENKEENKNESKEESKEENKNENKEENKENKEVGSNANKNESKEENIENKEEKEDNKANENGNETENCESNENENNENEEDQNEIKNKDDEENVDILNGGTSPNRGEEPDTEKQKQVFEVTVVVDGFLREDRPSENTGFDSMELLNISPSPLFAKLSDVFKKKGIVSAGKFNYDI